MNGKLVFGYILVAVIVVASFGNLLNHFRADEQSEQPLSSREMGIKIAASIFWLAFPLAAADWGWKAWKSMGDSSGRALFLLAIPALIFVLISQVLTF
jgi:hypothetical protein